MVRRPRGRVSHPIGTETFSAGGEEGETQEDEHAAMCGTEWKEGAGGRRADSMSVNRIVFFTLRLGAQRQLSISKKLHLHF